MKLVWFFALAILLAAPPVALADPPGGGGCAGGVRGGCFATKPIADFQD